MLRERIAPVQSIASDLFDDWFPATLKDRSAVGCTDQRTVGMSPDVGL